MTPLKYPCRTRVLKNFFPEKIFFDDLPPPPVAKKISGNPSEFFGHDFVTLRKLSSTALIFVTIRKMSSTARPAFRLFAEGLGNFAD